MNNLLKINNLNKIYFNKNGELKAIDNLNLEVNKNDFIALVGPSGCGKSTILSIISNIEKKTSGDIIYQDNITVGYMFQQDCLCNWLNILDNCLIGLKIQKKLTEESKSYVINLLNKYGLKDFINNYPNNLSGGMKQRVALIRSLATNPDILLLDEPFSALDYRTRIAVSNDVYRIIKEENKTAIIVTHDLAEAISLANKIIVLSHRPTTVKKIYNISFNDTIPEKRRNNIKFNEYHKIIWDDIDE